MIAGAPLLALLGGCASTEAQPPVTTALEAPAYPPGVDPLSPEDRLLALITADNPRLQHVATSLAHLGNAAVTREAGVRLVRMARAVDEQSEGRQTEALTPMLAAMAEVGGPVVVAYAFALAENELGPRDRRRLAVQVLQRVLDSGDAAGIERRERVAARVPPTGSGSSFTPASAEYVVRQCVRAIRPCFGRALEQDAGLRSVTARIRVHTGTSGPEFTVEGDGLPPELAHCLGAAVQRMGLAAQWEWPGDVTMPLTFIRQ